MSAYEIAGLIHVLAISMSMISIAAILILKKQKVISFTKVNSLLFSIAFLVMAISVMYFIIDYYSAVTGVETCCAPVRVADAWITVSIQFGWFFLMRETVFPDVKPLIWSSIGVLYGLTLAVNLINYGFFMDENYYVEDETLRFISLVFEMSETGLLIVMNLLFMFFFGGGEKLYHR